MQQGQMVLVEEFIDALKHFTSAEKEKLKQHIEGFGAQLKEEYDQDIKDTLQSNLPSWLNPMQYTVLLRAVRASGTYPTFPRAAQTRTALALNLLDAFLDIEDSSLMPAYTV